ncbi:MAG: AlpA family transcriptional regulator [Comamonadaceae bacterium]|nr:MAG: AlpA family transcriptional regulator [Comamonadaceae bacterium]
MPKTLPAPTQTAAEPAPTQARAYRERLLRIDDVCFFTGLGRSTVYAKVKAGDFPGPVQLHGSCVAWRETEVDAWIAARPAALPVHSPRVATRSTHAGSRV